MELDISQGSWNAFISFSDCSSILGRKKHQLATFLQDLFDQSELTVLSGMEITQESDGERMILTGKFYLLGKEHREKVLAGTVLQEEQFQVGPFSAPRAWGSIFFSVSTCIFLLWFSSFTVFLAGSVVPFISDLQPWPLPQVRCSSSCYPLRCVGLSELGARGLEHSRAPCVLLTLVLLP